MLYENIKTYVLNKLGAPIVDVELTDEAILTNAQESIERYLYYRNKEYGIYYFNSQDTDLKEPGKNGYTIPPAILGNIFAVVIANATPLIGFAGLGDGSYYMSLLMQSMVDEQRYSGTPGLADYSLTLNFQSSIKKLLGTDITYEVLDDKLYLYPNPDTSNVKVGIKYIKVPSQNSLDNCDWIKRNTLALCKGTLGIIRSKYPTIPSGTSQITTDGEALKSESERDVALLFEEIKSLGEPPLPGIF
jgi:hypothetical protein